MLDSAVGGPDTESSFLIQSSIKTEWDAETSTLQVRQGQHTHIYGMKYHGFSERLVLTPLTDRFFLAISNTISSGAMPVVLGPEGAGRHQTVRALACALGADLVSFDLGKLRSLPVFIDMLRAHLQCGFWCNYLYVDEPPPELLSTCMTAFSAVQNAL
ncbi:hypothetical protein B484DRAFT_323836, partial [Ochromonadaceae sp. CCMP2298]